MYINWISSLCNHLKLIGPCDLPLTLNKDFELINPFKHSIVLGFKMGTPKSSGMLDTPES